MPGGRPVAVVGGAVGNKAGNGGEAWVRPTWTVGLDRVGFDTWLVEDLPDAGGGPDPAAVAWFDAVTSDLVPSGRVALCSGGRPLPGHAPDDLEDVLAAARVVVDHSGHLAAAGVAAPGATWVYVDLDPGFTQVWAAAGAVELGGHDAHVTVGTAVGRTCRFPDLGLAWVPTLPPVLVDRWPATPPPDGRPRVTTVGSWRPPHGTLEHAGRTYGVKAHEFRRHLDLPRRCAGVDIEAALAVDPADDGDRRRLLDAGFLLADPGEVAGTPAAFAAWVDGSWGEWSVAQGVYVDGRTGWVSDRSAHYLAAGRPVVVQDTGALLPGGADGAVLTFSDVGAAADAICRVVADPAGHAAAARSFARSHLDAAVVLGDLCERLGVLP